MDEKLTLKELCSGEHEKELTLKKVQDAIRTLGKLPLTTLTIPKGALIYRARSHRSATRFHFPQQVSFNPDLESVRMGRANAPGKPMFYGSYSYAPLVKALLTVCMETSKVMRDKKLGFQTFTVGVWEVRRPISIPMLHGKNADFYDPMAAEIRDDMEKRSTSLTETLREKVAMLNLLLSREFGKRVASTDPSEKYLVSAAFADMLYDVGSDGLAYPSVEANSNGQNVALTPFAVQKWLVPVGAQLVQFHRKGEEEYQVCQYAVAYGSGIPWSWTDLHPRYAFNNPFINDDLP